MFVMNLRRLELVFGPDHVFSVLLRWLLQLLGRRSPRLFFSGPTDLKTDVREGGLVYVTWKPPKYVDPDWDGFIVKWHIVGLEMDDGRISKRKIKDKDATTVKLPFLIAGRDYRICVAMAAVEGKAKKGLRSYKSRDLMRGTALAFLHSLILVSICTDGSTGP